MSKWVEESLKEGSTTAGNNQVSKEDSGTSEQGMKLTRFWQAAYSKGFGFDKPLSLLVKTLTLQKGLSLHHTVPPTHTHRHLPVEAGQHSEKSAGK